jgi:group I intron endonuclease
MTQAPRRVSGVYRLLNKINNRLYIGSSLSVFQRRDSHFSKMRRRLHTNKFLENDFHKCGEASFEFSILEICLPENLLKVEQKYLDQYYDNQKMCYNLSNLAEAPSRGRKLTFEHKQKLSNANRGVKLSKEHKEALRKAWKTRPPMTSETRRKLSVAQLKRWARYRENKECLKRVV